MTDRWAIRPMIVILLIVLLPVLPLLIAHEPLQRWATDFVQHPPADELVVLTIVLLLSTDVFLPVPSSLISTLAGAQLTPVVATLASWTGLTLGAMAGFVLARRWGWPVARRFTGERELQQMQQWSEQYGAAALIVTRGLPVLAETAVLWTGVTRMSWGRFLPAVSLTNLGIALAYALFGRYAADQQWLPAALGISVALPLLLTAAARRHFGQKSHVG